MAKVSITIDEASPAIAAGFGENALTTVAEFYGWKAMVPKTEEELPAKVMQDPTTEDIEMGMTEPYEVYPEGTEMEKPNPQSAAVFVSDLLLRKHIAPFLTK